MNKFTDTTPLLVALWACGNILAISLTLSIIKLAAKKALFRSNIVVIYFAMYVVSIVLVRD